jgi:hypothetical protein
VVADGGAGKVVAWRTAAPCGDPTLLAALVRAFPNTGLWPVRLSGEPWRDRPWNTGEMSGPHDSPVDDVDAILRRVWDHWVTLAVDFDGSERPGHPLAPYGLVFPGLAVAEGREPDVVAVVDALGRSPERLGLVAVRRPAEVPMALGVSNGCNYDLGSSELSAVLRSWEDRFGAVLVEVGFDTMTVVLPEAPTADAVSVAAELIAFCPDLTGGEGAEHIIASVSTATTWRFWWD